MTSARKAVFVAGVLAVGVVLYIQPWKPKLEPGSRAWQVREFRKDWRACGEFASRREEARRLLAWKPKAPWVNPPGTEAWEMEYEERRKREAAEAEAKFRNLDADLAALGARLHADELDCLRDLDWPDVQIETLKKEVTEEDKKRQR